MTAAAIQPMPLDWSVQWKAIFDFAFANSRRTFMWKLKRLLYTLYTCMARSAAGAWR